MTKPSSGDPEYRCLAHPVGWVESSLIDLDDAPSQGNEGAPSAWLVFIPGVYEAARDIQVGDKIVVVTWLHLARRDVLRTYPRDLVNAPHLGVFSLRSQDRPNPIGLHLVEVVAVMEGRIQVNHLEAVHGTPVLDVKPTL
jgi:tRNA-Thr(GGU) m(6)t(6)A37 methyltransferase TsaA